jgi:probable rRNA maturation factor
LITVEVEIDEAAWSDRLPALAALAAAAAAAVPGEGEAAVLFTSDATVRALNARFRLKDQPTNVLSFPCPPLLAGEGDPEGVEGAATSRAPPPFLGDIAVAFGVVEREARDEAKPLTHHVQHLVVHGLLHLMGHDHQDDRAAEAMEDLERRILADLDVPDPYVRQDSLSLAR